MVRIPRLRPCRISGITGARSVSRNVRRSSSMSDNYVHIIPEEPGLVPDAAKHQVAVAHFRGIAPRAGEITASVSGSIEFIHCGANFEKILCPSCGAVIDV